MTTVLYQGYEFPKPHPAFPLSLDAVHYCKTPRIAELCEFMRKAEQDSQDALDADDFDNYKLFAEVAAILFDEIRVLLCMEFVSRHKASHVSMVAPMAVAA